VSARIDVQTEDLRLFVACVSEGSLSAAARTMGLTQAVASRRIQRLEEAVGAPVLHRTTRSLRPTADGERLMGAARAMLAELAALESSTVASRATPSGDVRVSASILLGQSVGSALAVALRARHPELRLVLALSNTKVDRVRDGIDVALRVGALPSTTLLAARLATARIGAYAARARLRTVEHPSELLAVPWVGLLGDATLRATSAGGQRWSGRVDLTFACDDRLVLRSAAAAGLGVTLLPTFLGDAEPALRRVAPEWHFGTVPVHVLWLPESRGDPRVRAVIDVMTEWGAAQKW
jgi:DNA-binding transcriptional LysR family regulator